MKLVIFGLAVSSSWGNGHATLWRGLCGALAAAGHRVMFFERDVPYYASHRDLIRPHGWTLRLYRDWNDVRESAEHELCNADVGMVMARMGYCPSLRRPASELALIGRATRARVLAEHSAEARARQRIGLLQAAPQLSPVNV